MSQRSVDLPATARYNFQLDDAPNNAGRELSVIRAIRGANV